MSEEKKVSKFKVGTNFDNKIIDLCKRMNDTYGENRIVSEMYGSDRFSAKYAARPNFRLPDIKMYGELETYIRRLHRDGIQFNYTMNSIFPGSKVELDKNKSDIISHVKNLENIGVDRITIANLILAPIIHEASKNMKMELSTIAHVDTVSQIRYLKEEYGWMGLDKICGNLLKNRSFDFLESAANVCEREGMAYEIMVNEFCGVGYDGGATHCVYRDSCYLCHATNRTLADTKLLDGYPMEFCMSSRNDSPAMNWLKMRFVRPEDIEAYNAIGIWNFKITGRTDVTEHLSMVIEGYLSGKFDNNLLQLWKHLETIGQENKGEYKPKVNIQNSSLNGFLDHWSKNKFECANVECGVDCKYCEKFYKRNCV